MVKSSVLIESTHPLLRQPQPARLLQLPALRADLRRMLGPRAALHVLRPGARAGRVGLRRARVGRLRARDGWHGLTAPA